MIKKFASNPLDNIVITQGFGLNCEYYKKYGLQGHNGIDLRTVFPDSPQGRRDVYAVMDGIVVEAVSDSRKSDYGKYIRIKHEDDSESLYAHLFSLRARIGQPVHAGTMIAISDNTGKSTGPHLHFGYRSPVCDRKNGYAGYVDPRDMFIIKKGASA